MSGRLWVVGLGPGDPGLVTPDAALALREAEELFGYGPYLERVPPRAEQRRHSSDNRQEASRARAALERAACGARVALVSGGDPGVFAMAAAVCEQLELGPADLRAIELEIVPGVTAMLAVAARAGAPLGHDFCAISLSDNLKPWALVERRLRLAVEAGFVIALYNPVSRARPWQLARAFECLRESGLGSETPVLFGRAVSRDDEALSVHPLSKAPAQPADMATLVIVGSPHTRVVDRGPAAPLVYTPRSAGLRVR